MSRKPYGSHDENSTQEVPTVSQSEVVLAPLFGEAITVSDCKQFTVRQAAGKDVDAIFDHEVTAPKQMVFRALSDIGNIRSVTAENSSTDKQVSDRDNEDFKTNAGFIRHSFLQALSTGGAVFLILGCSLLIAGCGATNIGGSLTASASGAGGSFNLQFPDCVPSNEAKALADDSKRKVHSEFDAWQAGKITKAQYDAEVAALKDEIVNIDYVCENPHTGVHPSSASGSTTTPKPVAGATTSPTPKKKAVKPNPNAVAAGKNLAEIISNPSAPKTDTIAAKIQLNRLAESGLLDTGTGPDNIPQKAITPPRFNEDDLQVALERYRQLLNKIPDSR
jgi:hypothetical protein